MGDDVYNILNRAWHATTRAILGEEVGDLKDYEKWLTQYSVPMMKRKSSISGKDVYCATNDYSTNAKFTSLDELDFGKKFDPLNINEIKDIDSITESLQERFYYCGDIILFNSKHVESSSNIQNSSYVLGSNFIYDSEYVAYSSYSKWSKQVFAVVSDVFCSNVIRAYETHKQSRCFEAWKCYDSSDCYFSSCVEGSNNVLFSFNIKNKRNVIGNIELDPVCSDEDKQITTGGMAIIVEDKEEAESVYAFGSGFIPNKQMAIYVVEDKPDWNNGDKLEDLSGGAEVITTGAQGEIPATVIWDGITSEDAGLYDIVVDVNNDSIYSDNPESKDAVDALLKGGFAIQGIDSADSSGEIKDDFYAEAVYAKGNGISFDKVDIFVIKNDPLEDGDTLEDISEDIEVNVEPEDGEFLVSVWSEPEPGRYDIVLDIDQNGEFNSSIDLIDRRKKAGFIVKSNWTFMAYISAEKDLKEEALEDLNEMELIGSSAKVAIVAQVDLPTPTGTVDPGELLNSSPTRILISKDNDPDKLNSTVMMVLEETNMGSTKTLTDFVDWSATCYPAQKYVLVLWGNGDGWKVKPTHSIGLLADHDPSNDAMEMSELKASMESMPGLLGKKLDILAFDAPLMASVEVADQVKEGAGIMIASQGTAMTYGNIPPTKKDSIDWDYEIVLNSLTTKTHQTSKMYSKEIVKHAENNEELDTLSAINLSNIDELVSEINGLAGTDNLRGTIFPEEPPASCGSYMQPERTGLFDFKGWNDPSDNVQTGVLSARLAVQTFGGVISGDVIEIDVSEYAYDLYGTEIGNDLKALRNTPNDPVWGDMDFIDIYHFALLIKNDRRIDASYRSHAIPIMNLLEKDGEIIIDEYHSHNFENAHGISIYFPFQRLRSEPGPLPEYCYEHPFLLTASVYHSTPGLQFIEDAPWWNGNRDVKFGRFLYRYYSPVADISIDGGKEAEIFIPDCNAEELKIPVSVYGTGSSGSDFEGFASFGSGYQSWYIFDGCIEYWNDKFGTGINDGYPQSHETQSCDDFFDGGTFSMYEACGCYVVTLDTIDDDYLDDVDWGILEIKEEGGDEFIDDWIVTPYCPNGILDPGEECDGPANPCPFPAQVCIDCVCIVEDEVPPPPEPEICGDGLLQAGEECDNAEHFTSPLAQTHLCPSGDPSSCVGCLCIPEEQPPEPACGNGILEAGEECDILSDPSLWNGTNVHECYWVDESCIDCKCIHVPDIGWACVIDGYCAEDENDSSCPQDCDSPDSDGDGVIDEVDNCPQDANPDQVDCDEDGIGTACDPCSLDANNDADNDGYCGDVDNCPGTPNDQTDQDGDGTGDACDEVPLDCAGYCSSQGFQETVAQDVSQSECEAYQYVESPVCQTTCTYMGYRSWGWSSGETVVNEFSCCCRTTEYHSCFDCPGLAPYCPECPDAPVGTYGE